MSWCELAQRCLNAELLAAAEECTSISVTAELCFWHCCWGQSPRAENGQERAGLEPAAMGSSELRFPSQAEAVKGKSCSWGASPTCPGQTRAPVSLGEPCSERGGADSARLGQGPALNPAAGRAAGEIRGAQPAQNSATIVGSSQQQLSPMR